MTTYKINCHKCTYTAINTAGELYCLAVIEGNGGCYVEDGHDGTKDDSDPICCDYYTTEPRQAELYETAVKI